MAFKIKQVVSIFSKVREYSKLRSEKKVIDDRMKVLSQEIKEFSLKNGEKDSKGSFYCETEDFMFGAVAKKSIKFDTNNLVKFLKNKGLTDCYSAEVVYSLNEKRIEDCINLGLLTEDDIKKFTEVKTSYSVSCISKEIPDVQQCSLHIDLPVAASTKPKNKFKRGVK